MERTATFDHLVRFQPVIRQAPNTTKAAIPAVHSRPVHELRQRRANSIAAAIGASA